jgi:sortase A
MVSGRGRFSVLFLAIAALMFCLALVLTPSSRAQNQDNSTTAVAGGGEDCVDFEGQDNGTGTGQDTGTDDNEDTNGTSEDTTTDASDGTEQSQQNGNQDTSSDQQTQQDGNQDGRQTLQMQQDGNQDSQRTQGQDGNQDSEPGDLQQSLETGNNGDQQSQQDGEEGDQQTQQDGNQDGQQTQGQDGNNECVIASTVPDQSLLPTGAPAKSNAKETTAQEKSGSGEKQGNSDRDGEQSDRSGEQTKTDGGQKPKSGSENQKKTSSGGKKLEIEDHGKKIEVQDRSGKAPRQEKPETPSKSASANDVRSEPAPKTDLAPRLAATKWTRPSREEIAATDKPRSFTPGANTEMTLSVRAMGLYNVPVANSNRLEDLDKGLVRVPKTSQPWDSGHQRNVYVAGHYLGQPETQSRLVFYNLDELKTGDELVLKDGQGRPYKYRVSEKFATGPEDSWVMGQVRGRDMVTLQTCIPPDFGKRLVVRADRVRT